MIEPGCTCAALGSAAHFGIGRVLCVCRHVVVLLRSFQRTCGEHIGKGVGIGVAVDASKSARDHAVKKVEIIEDSSIVPLQRDDGMLAWSKPFNYSIGVER